MKFKLILKGDVQGVGCRYYCKSVADAFRLHGSATNMSNGNVEVTVESEEEATVVQYSEALKNNRFKYTFYGYITSIEIEKYFGSIEGDYNW